LDVFAAGAEDEGQVFETLSYWDQVDVLLPEVLCQVPEDSVRYELFGIITAEISNVLDVFVFEKLKPVVVAISVIPV
jgi:hypothetical protein